MINVISFSLWGDKPIYTIGSLRNADLAKQFYPEFQCWFYIHIDTVPQHIIDELQSKDNVKIIFKTGNLENEQCKPRMWRFEAIDCPDVQIMMCRDTDTRILLREKIAVDEWLKSDKICHIMRDHPWHNYEIQAGMFGLKKTSLIAITDLCTNYNQVDHKMYDQDFLKDIIYPLVKNNSIIHASFNKYEDTCLPFPIEYDDEYHFVGEYVYEDESRNMLHSGVVKQSYLAI